MPLSQAAPIEGNLREWHANLWMAPNMNSAIQELEPPLHLILRFPEEYPTKPPTVECCTPFPHSNVVRKSEGKLMICLDMLEPPPPKALPYAGWSSAMSVLSILLQLQSFLSSEKLQYAEGMGSMERAREYMARFECAGCPHNLLSNANPWPARADTASRPPTRRRLVCKPCGMPTISLLPTDTSAPAAGSFVH